MRSLRSKLQSLALLTTLLSLSFPAGVSAQTCPIPTISPFDATSFYRLPDGKPGVFYSQTITASGGSGSSYYWQLTGGALPPGMSLSGVGLQGNTITVSGTPTSTGDSGFSIAVRDAPNGQFNGNCSPASENYRINIPHVNLVVSQSATPNPVKVGNDLAYTIDVVNHGPDPATNVGFTFSLSPTQSIKSATWRSPRTSTVETPCSLTAANVTCAIGNLSSGLSDDNNEAVVTVLVGTQKVGPLTSTASVDSGVYEDFPSNNQSQLQVTVDPAQADIDVAVLQPTNPLVEGDVGTMRFAVENHGPDTARNVLLTIKRGYTSSRFELTSMDDACSANPGEFNTVECPFPSIASGSKEIVRISGIPKKSGELEVDIRTTIYTTNEAAPTHDPEQSNNIDSANLPVKKVADLGIKFTDDPRQLRVGDTGLFKLKISNHGPSPAEVRVIVVTNRGRISKLNSDIGCGSGTFEILCEENLKSGERRTVSFRVTWADPGDVRVSAQIRLLGNGTDPVSNNNKDSASVEIID